jgi:hypothetical protein
MTTDNFCFYLQNRLIQTSQTGGQRYRDTSPFSIPWFCPAKGLKYTFKTPKKVQQKQERGDTGNPSCRGRHSTSDLLVLTSLDQFLLKIVVKFFVVNEEVNCTL